MSNQKKENPKSSKLSIPKREPGKAVKTNFMQNLRQFPTLPSHPVDDLLGLSSKDDSSYLDAQMFASGDAQSLDSTDVQQISVSDVQTHKISDAQRDLLRTSEIVSLGRPHDENTDAQDSPVRAPKDDTTGRPMQENMDVLASESELQTPKKERISDVKTPEQKSLDVRKDDKGSSWAKYERNRSTARLALRPNSEILRKFKVFCAEKDLGLTEFFEISGLRFIELDAQSKESLDALTPLDDRRLKMLYKTAPTIINLYLAYNAVFNEISSMGSKGKWSGKWTPRDDEAAQRYNNLDPRIIELGIIQTQTNKGIGHGKIQTFKYYIDEIESVLGSGVSDEMLETILQYHRKVWMNLTKREVDLSFLQNEK